MTETGPIRRLEILDKGDSPIEDNSKERFEVMNSLFYYMSASLRNKDISSIIKIERKPYSLDMIEREPYSLDMIPLTYALTAQMSFPSNVETF